MLKLRWTNERREACAKEGGVKDGESNVEMLLEDNSFHVMRCVFVKSSSNHILDMKGTIVVLSYRLNHQLA